MTSKPFLEKRMDARSNNAIVRGTYAEYKTISDHKISS